MKLPSDDPFIRLINEILRINGRTRLVFADVETATGLATMELSVLASVAEAGNRLTVSEIGRALAHPRQVIQRAANALVAAGLLEFKDNPRHKRAKVLHTTDKGDQLKECADHKADEIARIVMQSLSNEQCVECASQLREVRHAMDRYIILAHDHRS